jgi:hypothetical protein
MLRSMREALSYFPAARPLHTLTLSHRPSVRHLGGRQSGKRLGRSTATGTSQPKVWGLPMDELLRSLTNWRRDA